MKDLLNRLELTSGLLDYTLSPEETNIIVSHIKELESTIKHLIDLQKNMDKQYEKLEINYFILKSKYNELIKNLKCDCCIKGDCKNEDLPF